MLILDTAEQRKLKQARMQPHLHFMAFCPLEILRSVHRQHFPNIQHDVRFCFVSRGYLSCVIFSDNRGTIYAHQILNHSVTPVEVVSLVCKHELLHLEVPSRLVDGKETSHPPEFREREQAICPERESAWEWIWWHLGICLRRRPRLERVDVTGRWKGVWSQLDLIAAGVREVREEFPRRSESWPGSSDSRAAGKGHSRASRTAKKAKQAKSRKAVRKLMRER